MCLGIAREVACFDNKTEVCAGEKERKRERVRERGVVKRNRMTRPTLILVLFHFLKVNKFFKHFRPRYQKNIEVAAINIQRHQRFKNSNIFC